MIQGRSAMGRVLLLGAFAAAWLGMTSLMTVLAWDQARAQGALLAFMAVFWLAGLFLAGLAVHAVLHALRFGRSTLVLDAVPASPGGWLSGVIRAPAIHGADVQLTVECERVSRSRNSTHRTALWRVTRLLDGTRFHRTGAGIEIPFAVRLPTGDEAARDFNRDVPDLFKVGQVDLVGEGRDWYVGVSATLEGVDYEDRFQVPVGASDTGVEPSPAPPREMFEVPAERLAARLPGRLEYGLDADVFVFPLKVSAIVWTLLFFAPALAYPALSRRLVPLPGAVKWVAIGCGVLGALAVAGLLLETRRIEITAAAVRIRRGLLGVGLHRTIPRAEIAGVEEETSTSEPPTHLVHIRLRNGKRYWAMPPLSEKDRAAALAARLRQVLQLA